MTPHEAYNTLEVSEDISDDDLKKEWRAKAFKYHPDRFPENPNKLKDINEAYQFIKEHRENPFKHNHSSSDFQGFGSIQDLLNNLAGNKNQQNKTHNFPPIIIPINISFKESILGSVKEIEYNKHIKCEACDGNGNKPQTNGCKSCNGFGRNTIKNGNAIYTSQCNKCYGRNIKFANCTDCSSKGTINSKVKIKINTPQGVPNNANLRMRGMGNFIGGGGMFGDAYDDAIAHITVQNDPDLSLDGNDVIYNLNISLNEAIRGCKKIVRTIDEEREITLNKLSKNRDEIKLDKLGVPPSGSQRIIINVDYPKDDKVLEKIMKILDKEGK